MTERPTWREHLNLLLRHGVVSRSWARAALEAIDRQGPGKGMGMGMESNEVEAAKHDVKVHVSGQERMPDGTWRELGSKTLEVPFGKEAGEVEQPKGELGVFGKLFDHAALKARAGLLCIEARAHGVAKHLLSLRVNAVKGSLESLLPAKLFEDHVDGAAKRVDAAKDALVKHFDDALAAHEVEWAKKAAEAAATVASYKATAEQATAAMGKKVAEVHNALTQAREQLLVETASVGVAKRRADLLAAALKRANAKLRALRHGKTVRR